MSRTRKEKLAAALVMIGVTIGLLFVWAVIGAAGYWLVFGGGFAAIKANQESLLGFIVVVIGICAAVKFYRDLRK